MKLISKTAIDGIFKDCKFDPRSPGPMKAIADMHDPDFFRKRAIECLHEAEYSNPIEGCVKAVKLLALAIFYYKAVGTPAHRREPQLPVNKDTRK
jgi:hypothetical protein